MTWPPDIANELPTPRDDEPSSLRRDIADELADHLVTSLSRELHFTPEESAAKETILDRFGDPRRIARQLWFDALQEKIMSQRVLIGAVLILAIACLGGAGLMVMLVRQASQTNQAMLEQIAITRQANEHALEQSREANAALLEKLATLESRSPASQEPPRSMEWNPIKVRLVKNVAGGAPAEGFSVDLFGHLLDTAKEIRLDRTTGADGIADLGLVRPGQHQLSIYSPGYEFRTSSTLTVLPGQEVVEEIVCPGKAPVADSSINIEWPDDLRPQGLWLIARFQQLPFDLGKQTWRPANAFQMVVVTAENAQIATPDVKHRGRAADQAFGFQLKTVGPVGEPETGLFVDSNALRAVVQRAATGPGGGLPPEAAKPVPFRPYSLLYQDNPIQPTVPRPVGRYRIHSLLIGERPTTGAVNGVSSMNILGGLIDNFAGVSSALRFDEWGGRGRNAPTSSPLQNPFADWIELNNEDAYLVHQRRIRKQPEFEIQALPLNEITIAVPPALADLVRKFESLADSR